MWKCLTCHRQSISGCWVFLEKLREEHSDGQSIRAFAEIENHLRDKKYGLVWEEHEEATYSPHMNVRNADS